MPTTTIENVRLAGVASAVPPIRSAEWDELDIPPDRFRRSRDFNRKLAIRSARPEQCQSDFCVAAAEKLLADLGWDAADIDVVAMVTITPDYPIPATAIIVQDRLGMKKSSLAFDLPGSSATFFHGMQVVASMLSAGHLRRGLLLCGEVSKSLEGPDAVENFEHICGHNGSVFAFEHSPGATPIVIDTGGDGSAHEAFYMPIGGTRRPPQKEMFANGQHAIFDNPAAKFVLDVEACHETAARELPGSARAALVRAGREVAEVDHCFVQSMGSVAEESLRSELGLRKDRFHGLTHEYGAGGSGGIALGLLARAASAMQRGPQTLLLTGLGAGLAWGTALLQTDRVVCPDFVEM